MKKDKAQFDPSTRQEIKSLPKDVGIKEMCMQCRSFAKIPVCIQDKSYNPEICYKILKNWGAI